MDKKLIEKIDPFIKEFINILLTEYGINQNEEELFEEWIKITKKTELIPKEIGCTFSILKGDRRGQPCGLKKVKDSEYCLRHKNMKNNKMELKKHVSLRKYWDPVTKFVFENAEGGVVIGKTTKATVGESCPILELTEKDLEKCKEKKLIYKPTTFKKN